LLRELKKIISTDNVYFKIPPNCVYSFIDSLQIERSMGLIFFLAFLKEIHVQTHKNSPSSGLLEHDSV